MRSPTALRLVSNVNRNIKEAHKADPILCHSDPPVIFCPDVPEFSPNFLSYGREWPALPDSAETIYAAQALTETAAPDAATP